MFPGTVHRSTWQSMKEHGEGSYKHKKQVAKSPGEMVKKMDKKDRMDENRRIFREQKLISKADVLQGIQELKEECLKQGGQKRGKESEYTKRRIREIERFENEIKRKVIFDAPDEWWSYSIEMRSSDISLFLEHYKVLFPAKGTPIMDLQNDEKYCLLTVKAKLLTVEEYAKLHRIEHVTAVTRIRRGKLRSAVKFGKEWRIPALSPPPTEGYTPATYSWDTYLSRLPIRYELFNDYSRADFYQDQEDPKKYHAFFTGEGVDPLDIECDRDQRGSIEQLLVAHPDVNCESEVLFKI